MNLYTAAVLIGVGATLLQAENLDVKLGLWEVTTVTQSNGMPPMDLSKLTPEQQARVEAMMKQRQSKPQTTTRKACLHKEDLDKSQFLLDKDNNPSCKRDVVSTSKTLKIKMACAGNQKGSTDLNFEALSPENVRGTMNMIMGEGPRAMTVNATFTAHYLAPVCGDVK